MYRNKKMNATMFNKNKKIIMKESRVEKKSRRHRTIQKVSLIESIKEETKYMDVPKKFMEELSRGMAKM